MYNDSVEFACDSGYEIDGDAEATCLDNGTWSVNIPQCQRKLYHLHLFFDQSLIFKIKFVSFSAFLYYSVFPMSYKASHIFYYLILG